MNVKSPLVYLVPGFLLGISFILGLSGYSLSQALTPVVSALNTSTPASPARCPVPKHGKPPVPAFLDVEPFLGIKVEPREVLDYLNTYGPLPIKDHSGNVLYEDLTNDGIPEIGIPLNTYIIFTCDNGHYVEIINVPAGDFLNPIYLIQDGNKNGIPEIIFNIFQGAGTGTAYEVREWDGLQFRSLIAKYRSGELQESPGFYIYEGGGGCVGFVHAPSGPLMDIQVNPGIPYGIDYQYGLPYRNLLETYRWDGQYYTLVNSEFGPPEYRFQAVFDGDRFATSGRFEKALEMFDRVITDNTLKGWSNNLSKFLRDKYEMEYRKTPDPGNLIEPQDDPDERPNLAVYARFRRLWIYLSLDKKAEAQKEYEKLLTEFPENKPGRVYVEPARILIEAYNTTPDVQKACLPVRNYMHGHLVELFQYISPSVKDDGKWLDWFGNIDFGWERNSMDYSTEMVCPVNPVPELH